MTTITSFGERLRHIGAQFGGEAMKAFAVSIVGFAIIASVIIYRAQAEPRLGASRAEPCVGLACWPPEMPVKHRPAYRPTLPPAW